MVAFGSSTPPIEPEALRAFVQEELRKTVANFSLIDNLTLVELNVAPGKPRTGMFALADGTNWNPGGGAGVYVYFNGGWNLLTFLMVEVFSADFSIDFS